MGMVLDLFGSSASADDNAKALQAALEEFSRRGVSIEEAITAAVAAGDLPIEEEGDEDAETSTKNSEHVAAWYSAEHAACEKLLEIQGEWPSDVSLIAVATDVKPVHPHP